MTEMDYGIVVGSPDIGMQINSITRPGLAFSVFSVLDGVELHENDKVAFTTMSDGFCLVCGVIVP